MNIKRILTPLLIILLLFSIVVMGAPTYVNLGPTSEITGDVGVPDGSGYYINDILFSTIGLIDISTLAETDSNFIVGDGTNWVVESGATARASLGIDLSLYYLKTEIDTKGEMQTIWSVILPDLTGTPVQYDYGRFTDADTFEGRDYSEVKTDLSLNYVENLKVKLDATQAPTVNNDVDEDYTVGSRWFDVTNDKEYACLDNTDGAAVWTETTQSGGGGAFTDLTDTPANYTGSSLKHVRVNVGETALEFVTLGGGGDMLKATYDTDEDGDVDVAAGGTEKSSWTLYAIPYLLGTTAFGEIPIGTAEYALTVNVGANGYDWTELSFTNLSDTPSTYTGKEGKTLRVNSTPDAVEFTNYNNVTTKTGTATLTVAEQGLILVSASSAYTIILPTAVGNLGLTYTLLKTDYNYNLVTLDGDGTETLNYENSTGTPNLTYLRLNTPLAEVTIVSDDTNWQVINEAMGQMPKASVYLGTDQLEITHQVYVYVDFDTENYDIGSNYTIGNWVTGTADGTVAGHLQDDGASQFVAGMVGKRVKNTTDSTYTYITTFNDAGDVTVRDDIFVNGEGYQILNSKWIAPFAGKANIYVMLTFQDPIANKNYYVKVLKNGVNIGTYAINDPSTTWVSVHEYLTTQTVAKDDVIDVMAYSMAGDNTVDVNSGTGTYIFIEMISKD